MSGRRESDIEACRRLSANLTAVMARRGMTQADFCRVSGFSSAAISNLMSCKHVPTICMVATIADALGTTVDRLVRPTLISSRRKQKA